MATSAATSFARRATKAPLPTHPATSSSTSSCSVNVEQDYGGRAVNLEQYTSNIRSHNSWHDSVMRYSCTTCGFNKTLSAVVDQSEMVKMNTLHLQEVHTGSESKVDGEGSSQFERLDPDVVVEITDKLSDQDVIRLTQAFHGVKLLLDEHNVLLRRQLLCFYFRMSFTEAVLGVGVEMSTEGSRVKPFVPAFDLFSHQAFKHGLRKGVTGETFQFFLPLVLDDNHYRRAEGVITESLMAISKTPSWSPRTVLETLPAMLNSMVLRLVRSCDETFQELNKKRAAPGPYYDSDDDYNYSQAYRTNRLGVENASEKALQGYCLLFHLFSKLVRSHPVLAAEIKRKVTTFMSDKNRRSKTDVPDLGEFLTYLLVVKGLDWASFCGMFLEELLARNVVWNLTKVPHLAYVEPENFPSEARLSETFKASQTSLKLVMFQVSFFSMTRSRESEFEGRYGYPSGEMSSELLRMIKNIYLVKDWDVFFRLVKYPLPEKGWKWQVSSRLKGALTLSEQRGYHVNPYSNAELYVLRRAVEQNCPAPAGWAGPPPPAPRTDNKSFFPGRSNNGPRPGRAFDQRRGPVDQRRRWNRSFP